MNLQKKEKITSILFCVLVSTLICVVTLIANNNKIENMIDVKLENNKQLIISKFKEYNKPMINVNTATEDELKTLPNIENALAKKIIKNRPYKNLNELKEKVDGIGIFIIENLDGKVVF